MTSTEITVEQSVLSSGTNVLVAKPSAGKRHRGVIVLTDIFGLRTVFEQMCARIAGQLDAVVYALDPFPGITGLGSVPDRLRAVEQLTDSGVLGDIALACDATEADRVDVVGFCLGGTWAYKASASDRVARAVSFYGPLAEYFTGTEGRASIQSFLANGTGPKILSVVAGQDSLTPDEAVRDVEDHGVTVVRFPDANHAFVHDPSHSNHRVADSEKAMTLALRWLGEPQFK
ncbi:dienelactone hydrolase family protein [Rhodococcus sp. T2V]|uniref:dienelactone hydrolase family protein n=1 Tax=Rhodococcus sp. T2V TaxID=3034164 RepID=UPI0023E0F457|nr:dienelactone hydrolase family protein [Rhodococcus sp. T2V]MDF3311080.1 dienelactone hydrolase family protein [Rhodococcus sp. T2V]